MKIEIGESLLYSWLRHIKGCQLVHQNWKVSQHWEIAGREALRGLVARAQDLIEAEAGKGFKIFKKNASFEQIIRQTECDMVGVHYAGAEHHLYLVEVAFHEKGINYGSKEETIAKILAKLVRNVAAAYAFLSPSSTQTVEAIFATPVIYPAIDEPLAMYIAKLNDFFAKEGKNVRMALIANDSFQNSVLSPVLRCESHDSNELFLRSFTLLKLAERITPEKTKVIAAAAPRESKNERRPTFDGAIADENLHRLKGWMQRPGQRNALVVNEFLRLLNGSGSDGRRVALDEFQASIDERYGQAVQLASFTRAYPKNDAWLFDLDKDNNICTIRERAWSALEALGWTSAID